jgi:FAD/FMN-containing dehydrogenase
LEATIVNAKGEIITVNSTSNSDLYWAIRGGGGSAWGLFTSITYRMHKIPEGGFT